MKTLRFVMPIFIALSTTLLIQAQNSWNQLSNFPGSGRHSAVSFSINGKGYFGTGMTAPASFQRDFWEFDPSNSSWTRVDSFPFKKAFGVGFAIGNKGYALAGHSLEDDDHSELYEYDPMNDEWTRKANFPGSRRNNPITFVIDGIAYVGLGVINADDSTRNDFWAYDPIIDVWKKVAPFPGNARNQANSFTIDSIAYVGCGYDGNALNDFWKYDPAVDQWTKLNDFPGLARLQFVAFSIGERGYFGLGNPGGSGNKLKDVWEYNPTNDSWNKFNNLPDTSITQSTAFVIDSSAYVVGGFQVSVGESDVVWQFQPDTVYNFGVGIEQLAGNEYELMVSPNPSSGNYTLRLREDVASAMIEVYGINGQLVETINSNQTNAIDFSINGDRGIYYVKITINEGEHIRMVKVIKA